MTEEYREEIEDSFEPYQEDLSEAIAKTRREWKNLASEKATRHFKEMYDIEMDFARRNDYLASAGNKMSQKEFERWEDAFADELRLADEEIQSGKLGTKSEAEAMQHMIAYCEDGSFEKSLEVQAGQHFIERDNDLRLAIRKSESIGSEDDLEYLNDFHPLIIKYFDLKYDDEKFVGLMICPSEEEDPDLLHSYAQSLNLKNPAITFADIAKAGGLIPYIKEKRK